MLIAYTEDTAWACGFKENDFSEDFIEIQDVEALEYFTWSAERTLKKNSVVGVGVLLFLYCWGFTVAMYGLNRSNTLGLAQ